MVGLNPVLTCLLAVEEGISRGDAVRDAVLIWLDRESRTHVENVRDREFIREVQAFLRLMESDSRSSPASLQGLDLQAASKTIYRQSFFTILTAGAAGAAILPALKELRAEIENQIELDMKAHVESLPLKMLIPLLLCMFPAFLILLLGPITRNFMESLK